MEGQLGDIGKVDVLEPLLHLRSVDWGDFVDGGEVGNVECLSHSSARQEQQGGGEDDLHYCCVLICVEVVVVVVVCKQMEGGVKSGGEKKSKEAKLWGVGVFI